MTMRTRGLAILAGLTLALLALPLFGSVFAGLVLLATLCVASAAPSVVGATRLSPTSAIDPRAVRRLREQHPGMTITEAAAIITGR